MEPQYTELDTVNKTIRVATTDVSNKSPDLVDTNTKYGNE